MPDEALRALERAARARPDDVAAGWAYARALERAGERRALFAELCRLDRLGDRDAALAIDRWAPPPRGLRAPRVVDVVAYELGTWALPDRCAAIITAVERTPAGLGLRFLDDGLAVLEPQRPDRVRLQKDVVALARRGDDLVVIGSDHVQVHAPSGEVLAEAPLRDALRGVVRGDRLVVGTLRATVEVIDLGHDVGRVLWSTPAEEPRPAVCPVQGVVLSVRSANVQAHDMVDGRQRWTRAPESCGVSDPWGVEGRGLVVQEGWGRSRGAPARFTELDVADGTVCWTAEGEIASRLLVAPSTVVALGPDEVRAIDRRGGATRWVREGLDVGGWSGCTSQADDVVYHAQVVRSPDAPDVSEVVLTALEIASGEVRFSHAAALRLDQGVVNLALSVAPDRVDVVVVVPSAAWVVTFAD